VVDLILCKGKTEVLFITPQNLAAMARIILSMQKLYIRKSLEKCRDCARTYRFRSL